MLLSWIVRRRWLTLGGLVIALLGIPIGAMTSHGVLVGFVGVGVLLMFAQIAISVTKNVKAVREGRPPQF